MNIPRFMARTAHIPDGLLRRLYDDPLVLSGREQKHYATCAHCQDRFAVISANIRIVTNLLTVPTITTTTADTAAALARLHSRLGHEQLGNQQLAQPEQARRHSDHIRVQGGPIMVLSHTISRPLAKTIGGVALIAALVGLLGLTPAGTLAQNFLTIFQPKQFVAVSITTSDLQGLPDLQSYGSMTQSHGGNTQEVGSVSDQATASGLTLLTPASLPASVSGETHYLVISQNSTSFTFSAAKAASAAATTGAKLPAMPAGVDGSTLTANVGPIAVTMYGGQTQNVSPQATGQAHPLRGIAAVIRGGQSQTVSQGEAANIAIKNAQLKASSESATEAALRHLPSLVIAQAPLPSVTSTGATVQQIENYLLAQPGISPQLAAAIKNIGDPTTTLPVLIPVNLASGHPVQVQGVSGLEIGDNTGLGSAVVWQKDGKVYGVAGLLPEDQVLNIANGLH